jgi:hypothetical protein
MGFNGSDNYVDFGTCPTILEIAQTSQTTMLAWVKVGPHSGEIGIISAFYGTGSPGWSWVAYENVANPCLSMLVDDGGDPSGSWIKQASPRLPEMTDDGTWHHVGITIHRVAGSDGVVYFHQDGVKNGTPSYVSTETGAAWGNGRNLNIGRSSYYPWGEWSGQIANVQIYKRILTDAEIKQNFAAQANRFQVPRSIVTDGLVLWLEAGDGSYPGSGTTWYDLSGNGYDATLVGGPTVTSRGVELNGSTQYITLAHGGNLAFSSGDFTISVWCNYNGGTSYGGIITNDYSSDNAWKIFKDGSQAYFRARSGSTVVNFPAYTLNTFHCYTYTRTGSLLQVYFDGVASSSTGSPASPTSNNNIAFGSYRYTDALNLLYLNNQTIGTTTLYNRALSAGEVAQNFRVQRERFGV